ncbi:MAG TPA: hypothetical protein VFV91_08880 [Gaiellaceae bacterium]|nr:hypothetical protein [Gaiellaceae bacterium]
MLGYDDIADVVDVLHVRANPSPRRSRSYGGSFAAAAGTVQPEELERAAVRWYGKR